MPMRCDRKQKKRGKNAGEIVRGEGGTKQGARKKEEEKKEKKEGGENVV